MIYIILLSWILLSAILCFGKNFNVNQNKSFFLFLVFGFMAIIMGLRALTVGVDTSHYKFYFDSISKTDISYIVMHFYTSSMEIGYALFMKLCSLIINDYYFFQIAFSVVFSCLAAKFLLDNSDNIFVAIVVFLGIGIYASAFNIARQMLATMLVANSWTYLKKGKSKKALLLVIVASTIHFAAILFLLGHILYFIRNKTVIFKFVPILVIICAMQFDKLFPIFTRFFKIYYNYYSNEKDVQTAGMVWIIWIIVLMMSFWIIYISSRDNVEHAIVSIFSLIWVICNIIGLSFNYFERVGLYFIPFVPIMFSFSGKYIKSNVIRMTYMTCMCLSFLAYFLISVLGSEQYIYKFFMMNRGVL